MGKNKKMTLWSLAWPIFIETALFMLLGFVDVLILSKYDDLAASSVTVANQAVSIATIIFTVVSSASAVLISQYLGAKQMQSASRIAALSLVLHLITGLLVSAIFLLFYNPILRFIGVEGKILEFGGQYLSIVGSVMFLQALMTAISVIIRNHGMTKISMYVTVGMNILNTIMDIVLVLGLFGLPKMGVVGVAFATSLSRFAGTVVLGIVLFTKVEKWSIFKLLKPIPGKDIRNIFKIGIPSAFESLMYNLSQIVITAIVLKYLTDTELITKTYVQNISMFFYVFAISIGQASQILIGHHVGAGQPDEAYRQGLRAFRQAILITITICAAGIVFRGQIMSVFTDDAAVIAFGSVLLFLELFLECGRTSNLVVISCLRGAGDVYFPTVCAIISMWVINVLGSYLLAVVLGWGVAGLWIAQATDEVLRGILMILRWRGGRWRTKSVVQKS